MAGTASTAAAAAAAAGGCPAPAPPKPGIWKAAAGRGHIVAASSAAAAAPESSRRRMMPARGGSAQLPAAALCCRARACLMSRRCWSSALAPLPLLLPPPVAPPEARTRRARRAVSGGRWTAMARKGARPRLMEASAARCIGVSVGALPAATTVDGRRPAGGAGATCRILAAACTTAGHCVWRAGAQVSGTKGSQTLQSPHPPSGAECCAGRCEPLASLTHWRSRQEASCKGRCAGRARRTWRDQCSPVMERASRYQSTFLSVVTTHRRPLAPVQVATSSSRRTSSQVRPSGGPHCPA